MTSMTDPMNALLSLDEEIKRGMPLQTCELNKDYKITFDQPNGQNRFSYTKIEGKDAISLSMFAATDPIDGVTCFNIGYAVIEEYRGSGLGEEVVNIGIKELKNGLPRAGIEKFYIDAVVGINNHPSIRTAEKIFKAKGKEITDVYSGEPALHYRKLVE